MKFLILRMAVITILGAFGLYFTIAGMVLGYHGDKLNACYYLLLGLSFELDSSVRWIVYKIEKHGRN